MAWPHDKKGEGKGVHESLHITWWRHKVLHERTGLVMIWSSRRDKYLSDGRMCLPVLTTQSTTVRLLWLLPLLHTCTYWEILPETTTHKPSNHLKPSLASAPNCIRTRTTSILLDIAHAHGTGMPGNAPGPTSHAKKTWRARRLARGDEQYG